MDGLWYNPFDGQTGNSQQVLDLVRERVPRDGESTQAFDPRPGVQMAQSASDYPIVDLYQLRCGEGCRTAKYFKFDS